MTLNGRIFKICNILLFDVKISLYFYTKYVNKYNKKITFGATYVFYKKIEKVVIMW